MGIKTGWAATATCALLVLGPWPAIADDNCEPTTDVLGTLIGDVADAIVTDEPCSVKAALDRAAEDNGLPAELLYAAAWAQSRWQQWDDNEHLTGRSSAPGLFRISKQVWSSKYDWDRIENDVQYHANAGAEIMAEAYDLVKRRTGWSGDQLLRATYAVFFGGPGAMNSPWDGRYTTMNERFDSALHIRPWEPTLSEECQVERVVLDDSPCTVKSLLDEMAEETGLPVEFLYTVAWTESHWNQWTDYDRPLMSAGGDHGLMQINEQHDDVYNFRKIDWDIEYNARAGASIAKWAYDNVVAKGYTGDNIWRAAYAVYNGGPAASARPWHRDDPRDKNFHRYMRTKPWESKISDCDNAGGDS